MSVGWDTYTEWVALILSFGLAMFLVGEWRGSRHSYEPSLAVAAPKPNLTPTGFREHEPITSKPREGMEISVLPATGTVSIVPTERVKALPDLSHGILEPFEFTVTTPEIRAVKAEALAAELAGKLKNEARLHQRANRCVRRARSRYNTVVNLTFAATRRPTVERALGIVIPIGTGRKPETVKLFTQQWKHQLEGAAA